MWCSVTWFGEGLAVMGQQLGSMASEGFSNLKDPVVLKSLGPSSSNTAPGCWQNEAGHKHWRSLSHRERTSHCHLQGGARLQRAASDSIPAWGSVCTLGVETCPCVSLWGSGKRTRSSIWQLQGLQVLGLCSCSALSQGGRDVTLPGTLLAWDLCCFLPFSVWLYQQSSVFSLKLSLG